MPANLWFWIIFNAGVLTVLAIDLFAFQQKAHRPSVKEAAIWTLVWVILTLGFSWMVWYWMGPAKAVEFLTGYLVEYSLSVDNIFVFVLIFSYFAVPTAYQHRVLFWGILSALVLRGVMIGAGAAFVQTFHRTTEQPSDDGTLAAVRGSRPVITRLGKPSTLFQTCASDWRTIKRLPSRRFVPQFRLRA